MSELKKGYLTFKITINPITAPAIKPQHGIGICGIQFVSRNAKGSGGGGEDEDEGGIEVEVSATGAGLLRGEDACVIFAAGGA